MTYGITSLTKAQMTVQKGANPVSDEEKEWTGKSLAGVRSSIAGKELFGVVWEDARIVGDKVIAYAT